MMSTTDREGESGCQPAPANGMCVPPSRSLAPGDWVQIEYQGRQLLGMIDRLQQDLCTFAYWEGGELQFGAVTPDQIGDRDAQLTAQFREAIALDPHYLAKFIARWTKPRAPAPHPAKIAPSKRESFFVQRFLFPE